MKLNNNLKDYVTKSIKFNNYIRLGLLFIFSFGYSMIFVKIFADLIIYTNLPIHYLIYIATIGLLIHIQICKFFNKLLFIIFPNHITL